MGRNSPENVRWPYRIKKINCPTRTKFALQCDWSTGQGVSIWNDRSSASWPYHWSGSAVGEGREQTKIIPNQERNIKKIKERSTSLNLWSSGSKYHKLVLPAAYRAQVLQLLHEEQGHQRKEHTLVLIRERLFLEHNVPGCTQLGQIM